VPLVECFLKLKKQAAEILRRIVIVVKMDLDFTKPCVAELGQGIEISGLVLFFRKEERVLGWAAIGIAEVPEELRVLLNPVRNATPSDFRRGVVPLRLKVVSDAEQ